jgi:hypothetical protein
MSMPVDAGSWAERRSSRREKSVAEITTRLWIASLVLRTAFIVSLLVVIVRVSAPQSSTIWTAYDPPSDLVRLVLGFAACLWLTFQLFKLPKDAGAYRLWFYLGILLVPFALICVVGVW